MFRFSVLGKTHASGGGVIDVSPGHSGLAAVDVEVRVEILDRDRDVVSRQGQCKEGKGCNSLHLVVVLVLL